jgi:hypothetical protein
MIVVSRGTRYAELTCSVCHAKLRPGDHVLASFRHSQPRAVHAHPCSRPRAAKRP